MGPHQSLQQKIAVYQPPLNSLILIDPGVSFRIYQHRLKLFEVMAHKFTLNNEEDVQKMIQNFIARYQHLYLVSTVYLKCDDFSTCGGYVEAVIFYQRIFTTLSKIKDIPINDALHFYAVAFKGFQILYQRFGYFQIYEDMFFLTQDSKLKVWCNRDISKNQPQQYLRDKTGKQQDMVRKIIFIIGQNTDQLTDNIQLKQRLKINGVRNFQMALQSLREICRQFGLSIPERVQCMKGLPSEEVRSVLDQYATNVRSGEYEVEENRDVIISQMRENNNGIMISKTQKMPFNSPTFIPPLISQNSQNTSRQFSTKQQSRQSTPQRKDLNIQSVISTSQQQPMIHTFNRRPQIPTNQNKKGIDLSLSTKKNSTNGKLNKTQSVTALTPRNKSQHSSTQKVLLPSPKSNANDMSTIIKNSQPIQKHGLFNTQAHQRDINVSPYQVKYIISPPVTSGQQFPHAPMIESRPNYHLNTNNIPSQQILIHQNSNLIPQQQIIQQEVSRNKSKVYPSKSQLIRNPSTLKTDSQFIKTGNVVQVNFIKNNNNNIPLQYIPPNPNVFRPSIQFQPSTKPIHFQINQKNSNSQKNNGIQKFTQGNINQPHSNVLTSSIIGKKSQLDGSLKRNDSTPVLGKKAPNQQARLTNPFQMVQNAHGQSFSATKTIKSRTTIPLTSPLSPYLPVQSASSRYMHSNKQLHDNIPDLKYHKRQSPKKTINRLFDTKVQQLQSFNFNESRFGDANSQNSRVLEIIGREKKDSMTSAFGDQQKWSDGIKYQLFSNNNQGIRYDNSYKRSDSFTDPKILQMLKRPSINPLKNQINSLKKGSKGNKMYEFSRQSPMMTKIPSIDKQVIQNPIGFAQYQSASKQIKNNWQQNYSSSISRNQFHGFPSLSNLSQINKVEENTPFQQGKSSPIFNSANLKMSQKRSKFNDQNGQSRHSSSLMKKQQPVAISEFFNKYEFVNSNNHAPTLEYSFSSKKQIPIQDSEWINKYTATTTVSNNNNMDGIIIHTKNAEFKKIQKKSQSFLPGYNSNESLEFELGKKLRPKNGLDSIQEEESMRKSSNTDQDDEFFRVRVSSAQRETVSNRKYKPAIDPEIGRDLQMFRKQKARNN